MMSVFIGMFLVFTAVPLQTAPSENMIEIMSSDLLGFISALRHRVLALARGQSVFFAEDPVTTLFALVEGGVDLIRTQPDGRRVVLQRARDNQVLAEASLYSDRYHCDAIVMRRTQCLAVEVEAFRRALAENDAFRQTWDAHLARELMKARQLTELLSRRTVRDRLDGWMQLHGNALPDRGTRTELADELGVSNEALYREIARRQLR